MLELILMLRKHILHNKAWLIATIFTFLTLGAGSLLIWHQQRTTGPKSVPLSVKQFQTPYQRQVITAASGGEVTIDKQVTISFPDQFASQDIVASFHALHSQRLTIHNQVGELFELTAHSVDDQQPIRQFAKSLTIKVQVPEHKEVNTDKLALYFFNEENAEWQALSSQYDAQTNTLVAMTDHFTVFAMSDSDPNAGSAGLQNTGFIVDDSDPEPYFVPGGYTDPAQPSFWGQLGAGYNGGSLVTGNSIDTTPRNWATWNSPDGLVGEIEVFVTIPDPIGYTLTTGATYVVTHAGGQSSVLINQEENRGGVVSLGTYTFNGNGSVYLSDVVTEQEGFFDTYVVFDAVSFGEIISQTDFTPPLIDDVRVFTDSGMFRINARVTDEGSGVATVYLIMNGQAYPMTAMGDDRYALDLPVGRNQNLDYYIVAYDQADNEGVWSPTHGYITRGAFYRLTGYYPGMIKTAGSNCALDNCLDAKAVTKSQIVGEPINTANGNLITEVHLLKVGGRPEIKLGLTYNSQSGRASIFGENWTHSYNYQITEVETPDTHALFVQYPDGKVAKFDGDSLEPEAGYFETLERDGAGYLLTMKDLSQLYFDAEGDLTRYEDANDNGLNFSYGQKHAWTLISQLESITADGGRSVAFTYNDLGLVETVTAAEKTLSFSYSDQYDLVSWTDANGGTTHYTYDDHNMVAATTAEGFRLMENTFDAEHRVVEHWAGQNFHQTFEYHDDQTVVTDAHGNQVRYQLNEDALVSSIRDGLGNSAKYQFTDQKQIKQRTDETGRVTKFEYDERGNLSKEIDAEGYEIIQTFDPTFNKPVSKINKLADHTTTWEYDDRGNLIKETHALGASRSFTYDQHGQLISETDFRGNTTHYSYSPEGDVVGLTDAEGNTSSFTYDQLGRQTSVTNPRSFTTQYGYDDNDNLLQIAGPDQHLISYTYDANNRLISETDANSGVTRYSYDHSNNLLSKENQLGFVTKYTYGPHKELLTITSPEGKVTQFSYDAAYNPITITEALGTPDERTTEYQYNERHDLIAIIDPLHRKTKYDHDALGRVIKKVVNATDNPLATGNDTNLATRYVYSPTGALLEEKDAEGNVTTYTYDELDRVIAIVDAEGQTTRYEYDPDSNQTAVLNPRGYTTRFEHDRVHRLTKITDAKNGVSLHQYDANSNLVAVTDPNSIITKYIYDSLDRRSQRIQNAVDGASADNKTNVTTKYTYDKHGNLVNVTNPRGYTTKFRYDAAHRQISITDAHGNSSSISYDKDDNIITTIDRNGHAWNYTYDHLNRQTIATNPENHRSLYQYNPVDNIIQLTNPRGKVWTHSYDGANRLVTTTDPLAGVKTLQYDKVGNVVQLTDENGHTDSFTYDKIYRLIGSTDAEGNITQRAYDPNSNLVKLTDAEGNHTDYVYDELDRLISKTNAENEAEQYSYDATYNLTGKTEADGTNHQYGYDPLYRLASVTNNAKAGSAATSDTNVTTRYEYDANSNLTTQTDANTNSTHFAYDELDRLIQETNPLEKTWQYVYDKELNLTQRIDANKATTNYHYYPDNQLATIDYPEYDVHYSYSETNLPITMEDNLGTTSWEYDDLDRMIIQHDSLGRNLAYSYDAVGNLTELTYPDGRSISHTYLKNDWLKRSQTSQQDKVEYTRNKVGVPTVVDRSNQTKSSLSYDKVYRPLEVADMQLSNKQPTISKFEYTYNDLGHQTKEVATYGWRQPAKVTTNYRYDGLHRVSEASSDDNQKTQYQYDAVGNRTQMVEHLKQGTETRSYEYNPANQLTSIGIQSPQPPAVSQYQFSYDHNGNRVDKLIVDDTGLDRGTTYAYDTENRLTTAQDYHYQLTSPPATPSGEVADCQPGQGKNNGKDKSADCNNGGGNDVKNPPTASDSAEVVTASESAQPKLKALAKTDLAYDGNGRRLVSTYFAGNSDQGKRTEFTFDQLDPVVEYNLANGGRQNLYRNSAQDLIAFQQFKSEQDPQGILSWYHHDGEGNISATSKHSGQSDHSYRYDEYGLILSDNGTPNHNGGGASGWNSTPGGEPHNSYTLTQKRLDPHTGLYYFGARHYDPEVGTWLTQDTYRGQIQNPQSLHRYMYNYASPVNYVDWQGYCVKPDNIANGCPADADFWTPTDTAWEDYSWLSKKISLGISGLSSVSYSIGTISQTGIEKAMTEPGYLTAGVSGALSADQTKQNELAFTLRAAGQLSGVDFALDAQDLHYDFTHWQWTKQHLSTTAIDTLALCPALGVIKVGKKADDIKDLVKTSEQAKLNIANKRIVVASQEAIEGKWYRSTFPDEAKSLQYHWEKHAQSLGKSMDQYTNDALSFYEQNKHLGQSVTLRDGTSGVFIKGDQKQPGGYFTNDGKVVTFWYE